MRRGELGSHLSSNCWRDVRCAGGGDGAMVVDWNSTKGFGDEAGGSSDVLEC